MFNIQFRMLNNADDNERYNEPIENTIVDAPCNMTAIMQFCSEMGDDRFVLVSCDKM